LIKRHIFHLCLANSSRCARKVWLARWHSSCGRVLKVNELNLTTRCIKRCHWCKHATSSIYAKLSHISNRRLKRTGYTIIHCKSTSRWIQSSCSGWLRCKNNICSSARSNWRTKHLLREYILSNITITISCEQNLSPSWKQSCGSYFISWSSIDISGWVKEGFDKLSINSI